MSTNSTGTNLPMRSDEIMWEIRVRNGTFDGLVGKARFSTPPEFLYAFRCDEECNGHMAAVGEDHELLGLTRLRRVALSRDDHIALYEPGAEPVDFDSPRERELLGATA